MSESYSNLFIKVKTLEEIKSTALVVIDTNVLLMGYQWKNLTFESVLKVLEQLSNERRLKIPSHIIREFAKNRPGKIEEMHRQIHTVMSTLEKSSNNGKSLKEAIPALSIVEREHSDVIGLEENYNKCIKELNKARKEYVAGLQRLQQTLSGYIDHDPILNSYKEIIENGYFSPGGLMDEELLEKEWKNRIDNNIPPGYKDKTKKENPYGDLIVWDHICKMKNDVIFVTADVKGDWVHTANDVVMGARRELVEEFYSKTKGKTFKILTPVQFISVYSGDDLTADIKNDLGSNSNVISNLANNFINEMIPKDNPPKSSEELSECIYEQLQHKAMCKKLENEIWEKSSFFRNVSHEYQEEVMDLMNNLMAMLSYYDMQDNTDFVKKKQELEYVKEALIAISEKINKSKKPY
ncbi:PIN-like domain-containing protein [Bacillus cereus]|uniref:PIN-like domain-containing protein n=1 Tax=Bacillus cereus TaxID=1396 RepID=UPI000BF5EA27|nr:PIN-like domain-containing protein [Bacillus cereus]PFQ19928.1 hypothetical protein COK16_27930 [Bacillus cereus]